MRVVLFTGKGGRRQDDAGRGHRGAAGRSRTQDAGRLHRPGALARRRAGGRAATASRPSWNPGLFGAHIDTRALLDRSWGELQGHLRTLLAGAGVDELVADELTVLPGVEELLALGEVRRATESGPWEVVVVDCGPTAETLRLLGLPEALSGYLERLFPAHRRAVRGLLAGLSGGGRDELPAWDRTIDALDGLAEQLIGLRALLADAQTSIRLVLTPERVVAAETRRTLTALALHGLRVDGLVANRVQPRPPRSLRGPAARWLRERHTEQQAVLAELAALRAAGADRRPTPRPSRPGSRRCWPLAAVAVRRRRPGRWPGRAAGTAAAGAPHRAASAWRSTPSSSSVLRLPGAAGAPLELARVDDDLAVTAGGTRRMVALPAVLQRLHGDRGPAATATSCAWCSCPTRRCGRRPAGDRGTVDGRRRAERPAPARRTRGLRRPSRSRRPSCGRSPCAALDRLEPALLRLRTGPPTTPAPPACAGCPVCARAGRAPRGAARAGGDAWPSSSAGC